MAGPLAVLNGQISILTSRQTLAGLGKYFMVTNPTPGTAIAYAQLAAFSATANGMFAIYNGNPSGGPNIYLDRLTLLQTATAPTGTSMRFEVYNETGQVTLTGTVATRTPVNINSGSAVTTKAVVQSFAAGAATVPAAVGTRVLQSLGSVPVGVNVAGDSVVVDFGSDGTASAINGLTAARATDPARRVTNLAPIIIAPLSTTWINMWGMGTNTPSYEFALSYVEI